MSLNPFKICVFTRKELAAAECQTQGREVTESFQTDKHAADKNSI